MAIRGGGSLSVVVGGEGVAMGGAGISLTMVEGVTVMGLATVMRRVGVAVLVAGVGMVVWGKAFLMIVGVVTVLEEAEEDVAIKVG